MGDDEQGIGSALQFFPRDIEPSYQGSDDQDALKAFMGQYAGSAPPAVDPNVTYADEYHKGVGGGDGKDNSYSSVGVDPSTLNDPTKFDFSKFLGNLKNQFSGLGGKIQDNPLQSLLFAALAARALTGGNRPTSTGGYTGPGINMGLKATRSPIAPINYKPYSGQPIYGPSDSSQVTYAAGGGLMSLAGGGMSKQPRYLRGATDGMADKIDTSIDDREPAKLSHGEFVIPADVVSHLGNGNSDAGADVLYNMMDKVRMARTGRKKQGKQINPNKFMPGGPVEDAKYVSGGDVQTFADGRTPTNTTTAQNLSSWAGPYVTDYLSKGQALANTPYQSFTQWSGGNVPLTAGTSPLQQQAYTGLSSLASNTPSQFGAATQFATQAGNAAQNLSYTPQNISAPQLQQYQMTQPQDVTGQTATAATLGSAPQATAQTGTAASAGAAPTYTGQSAQAAQLGPYQSMTGQTGTAASAGAAPEMQGQTAQAAQLGPYTQGIAALGNAAQAGAAPSFSGTQFQAPGQIGYQTVAGERVNAPNVRDLSMQAATSDWMPNLQMFQMKAPTPVQAASAGIATLGESPEMKAARLAASPEAKAALTDYQAKLQNYQMGPAERVGTQSILEGPGVGAYMSPYMQNVVDIQNREARRQADITRQADQARLAQAGAYGGSRQAIIDAERNRNLATQMGDIQEKGLQSAFQQAQQQFNTEQQARMQANLANQQAGLTVGQQNLAANLGVQQLGTQTGLQTALANQQAQQQTALANQALAGQYGLTQGQFEQAAAAANQQMKGQYGMTGAQLAQSAYNTNAQLTQQAALANQQAEFNAAQQNLAAALGVQSLGANLGQQMTLANLGNQQQANLQNLSAGLQTQGLQAQTGLQAQQLNQATGLQALLANQQAGINTGQFNAQMGYNTALQNAQLAQQAGLANQQVGAQFGLANLGNQQQMAMANLGNQQATNMANQQAANQFALAQAGYTQQAGLQTSAQAQQAAAANQALAGQYGLTNAQMAQQMGLANLGNQQAAAAANQQAANQFALAQAGYGQQANMQTSQQLQQQQLANQALAGQYGLSNAQMAQQMGLANLGNQQQTALANQALLGQYGLTQGGYNQAAAMQNAQLAQQAALANQQAGLTTGQQNLAAKLGVQNLAAQQNLQAQLANQQAGQFGANFGLQANQQQLAAAQALAGIGQGQFGTQLAGLQALLGAGTQQQQTEQAGIAALQNEYNKQMMYPYQQLQFQQGLLSGLPVAAATNTPNTSPLSQLYGGAGDLMAFYQKLFGGGK